MEKINLSECKILKSIDITDRLRGMCGHEEFITDVSAHILKYLPEYKDYYFDDWRQRMGQRILVIHENDILR